MKLLVINATSIGTHINRPQRPQAVEAEDYKFFALTQLHGRACQIAREVHVLLENGYADGALARWRSLHEVATVAFIIRKFDQETAERFLFYERVQNHELARLHSKHEDDLPGPPVDEELLESLKEERNRLKERFESYDLGHRPGWVAHRIKDPTWGTLQEEAGLSHLAPYYKMASQSLHGGPKGTLDRVGLLDLEDAPETPDVIAVGPTNAGLDLPAELTSVSLLQVTAALVGHRPSPSTRVDLLVLERLVSDVQAEFAEVSEQLVKEELEVREQRADRDIGDIALANLGPEKLFTDAFVQRYTGFDASEEFLQELPAEAEHLADTQGEWGQDLEEFVHGNSQFSSLWDLVEQAFTHWVDRDVPDVDVPDEEL